MVERGDGDVPLRLAAGDERRLEHPGRRVVFVLELHLGRGRATFEVQIDHELQPRGHAFATVRALERRPALFDLRLVARIIAPVLDRPAGDAESRSQVIPGADVSRRLAFAQSGFGEDRFFGGRRGLLSDKNFFEDVGDLLGFDFLGDLGSGLHSRLTVKGHGVPLRDVGERGREDGALVSARAAGANRHSHMIAAVRDLRGAGQLGFDFNSEGDLRGFGVRRFG